MPFRVYAMEPHPNDFLFELDDVLIAVCRLEIRIDSKIGVARNLDDVGPVARCVELKREDWRD
ncbi:MAG: hypothetical protein DMF90_25035, partial [Acidobacteria bacterium]